MPSRGNNKHPEWVATYAVEHHIIVKAPNKRLAKERALAESHRRHGNNAKVTVRDIEAVEVQEKYEYDPDNRRVKRILQ